MRRRRASRTDAMIATAQALDARPIAARRANRTVEQISAA